MSKLKRPEKVPVTTGANGASVAESSAMQPKKPPPILPPGTSINGTGSINGIARNAARSRRDAPPQALGRGQRSAGSRTASVVADAQSIQPPQPQPYVRSDSYILRKYRGCPASLIVHLHPTHFRFDQQDGTFSYKSPMKLFIEHLREGTVPHDLLEYLNAWNIQFYEGCLIVEVHNHKTITNAKESSQKSTTGEKSESVSIHNSNPYLTPSPWVPYPKEQLAGVSKSPTGAGKSGSEGQKPKTTEEKDKENMPAPGQPNKSGSTRARISTLVLHPTQLSQYIDIAIKATTPAEGTNKRRESSQYEAPLSASGARPQTPMLAIPSTPNMGMDPPPAKRQKREKMEIDAKNVYPIESQITLATTAPLFLEPTRSARDTITLLEALSHPDHSEPMPSPMMRKKTVAEMEAEDSAAQIEEQYMLTLDERYGAAAGRAAGVDVDGPVGGASFEPRFEKFKAIEDIKIQVAENKRREKIAQAEAAKKQQAEADAKNEKAKHEEAKRAAEEQRLAQLRLHQQQQANAQQAQRVAVQRQMQQQQQKAMQAAAAHGHPQANMVGQNGVGGMNPQQARFMQQNQIAQGQAASPVPRNSTPQNMSSPMVGQNMGVPMQASTSSMGGSPPRPGSVVPPASQMSPQMAQAMRAQSSQQSHGGTPRLANGTPNMSHNTPMVNQPRMTQPSPRAGQMAHAQQINMLQNQNLDPHIRQQILQQQQQQQQQAAQQRLRMAAAAQALGANGSPANGMTPQMAMQQQLAAQQQQMQGGNPGMAQTPLGVQYANQMRIMQAQHAAQAAAQGQNVPQNGMNFNMGMGRGAMTPQMIQQAQQQAQIQVQQQGQMAQPNLQMMQRRFMQQFYQAQLPLLQNQYPGGIPEGVMQQFKMNCQNNASAKVKQMIQGQALRAQQQQQQALMGAQGQMGMGNGMGMNMGMQQGGPQQGQMGMNIMQQNGGMQRPPGM